MGAGTILLKAPPALALAAALSGCVVVPVVDEEQTSCHTYTRSMSLKTVEVSVNCHDEGCLAVALTISAGSALISGSIVLTGNTVHWLEYQGTCSDSYLNTARQRFIDSLGKPAPVPAPHT